MAPAPSQLRAAGPRVAVTALTLLALGLSLVSLGGKSIWLDEATSIGYARGSLGSLWRVVTGGDPNMGLYYVLLHGWVGVFGEGERAVRGLSALFAAATVPFVYLVGARLFGRAAGLVSALLLAVDALFVHYAQEARSYALVLLLVTISSWLLVEELERPTRARLAAYVLVSVLAVYAHYFAVYVLAAHAVVLVLRRAPLRRWALAGACVGLLCVPAAIAAERKGTGGISWIPRPTLHALVDVTKALAGGSWTILGVALAGGCVAALREPGSTAVVAAWLVVPVLGSFVLSYDQPMFLSYYLIVALPALVLLAGAGVALLPRPVAAAAALGLVAVSALHLADWYSAPPVEDWRSATADVLSAARPGGGVVYYPSYVNLPVEYYERRRAGADPENLDRYGRLGPLGGRPAVFLVVRRSDAAASPAGLARIERLLRRSYRPADERSYHGVRIELFAPR